MNLLLKVLLFRDIQITQGQETSSEIIRLPWQPKERIDPCPYSRLSERSINMMDSLYNTSKYFMRERTLWKNFTENFCPYNYSSGLPNGMKSEGGTGGVCCKFCGESC